MHICNINGFDENFFQQLHVVKYIVIYLNWWPKIRDNHYGVILNCGLSVWPSCLTQPGRRFRFSLNDQPNIQTQQQQGEYKQKETKTILK